MTKFWVDWSVTSQINGDPDDDNLHDGDRKVVASGSVVKDGDEAQLRAELTGLLTRQWPPTQHAGTYDVDHVYDIKFTPL